MTAVTDPHKREVRFRARSAGALEQLVEEAVAGTGGIEPPIPYFGRA
jgi:hypothetical protein